MYTHPASESGAFAYLVGSAKRMMISLYVYKNLPQVRTHIRRWSEGRSAAASCVRFGREKETRWFGRALRHEAEERANVRSDAPGKEGDGEKRGILQ